jgi:hypothetical protein
MQFNSISDLYSKLSLKEVKRALQQTETKAKDANDKLMALVAARYPDLLKVADMVDDMAESQTECMEKVISIQHACDNIPNFKVNKTREIIKKRRAESLLVKKKEINSSQIIQQIFRMHIAKRKLIKAKLNKLKLIEYEKKQNNAATRIVKIWKNYKQSKKQKLEKLKAEKTKFIKKLLHHWVNQESWEYDDDAWLCECSVTTKEIEDGVQVHFPSCASPRLFVALHTMVTNSIKDDAIDFIHYFDQIIDKTTSSLARYQLLFDMRFAGINVKYTHKLTDLLDPIDHTIMDGLVNNAVKNALHRGKRLLFLGDHKNYDKNDVPSVLNHDKTLYDDGSDINSSSNNARGRSSSNGELGDGEVDQLVRAAPCPRFPIAALRPLPTERKKKSGSLSTALIAGARKKQEDGRKSNNNSEEPKGGGWWW